MTSEHSTHKSKGFADQTSENDEDDKKQRVALKQTKTMV